MTNNNQAKKAHCGGSQSSASASGALGAAAQCAPMAPPLSNRGGTENSRAESHEQVSFEHYSTFITDSKGRLIEVPLRRGVGNSAFIDQISFSIHEDTLSICAGLAFLWFNAHPAQVFMGDVGALSLGAMLGTIAVMVRQEIVFAIMAGVFLVEAISVFLQIGSLRMRNKRVFLMAPLHHHYEKKGWRETQVVIRFWIITIMLVVLGLMTLKLR